MGQKKNHNISGRWLVTKIFEKMVDSKVIDHAEHEYLGFAPKFARTAEIIAQLGVLQKSSKFDGRVYSNYDMYLFISL